MKKIFLILSINIIICAGCVTSDHGKKSNDACKRYTPITKNEFTLALLEAMTKKAYAAYSLGLSELVITQTLKDDFEKWYLNHIIGDSINTMLDMGESCSFARKVSYSNANNYRSNFRDLSLSAMAMGQKKMVSSKAESTNANNILSRHPLQAIKEADEEISRDL